jgi:hypothetical protein
MHLFGVAPDPPLHWHCRSDAKPARRLRVFLDEPVGQGFTAQFEVTGNSIEQPKAGPKRHYFDGESNLRRNTRPLQALTGCLARVRFICYLFNRSIL